MGHDESFRGEFLPATGATTTTWILVGAFFLLVGIVVVLLARKPA